MTRRRPDPAADLLSAFWNHPLDYPAKPGRRTPAKRAMALVVIVVLGAILAVAYRDTLNAAPGAAKVHQQLRDDIADERASNHHLESRADRLRDKVSRLRDQLIGGQHEVDRLHQAEAAAGLRAVIGDGVTVTVTDGPGTSSGEADPGKVYDRDLQIVVNTVWAYGAEAIAVNGQRLTATSAIRAAGGAIMIDNSPVSSPYKITAIGPDDLADTVSSSSIADTFDKYSAKYGMSMTVTESSDLRLPAAQPPALDNAKPGETK
ncbi:MAG TPA: DUF881 domain-containing protein [Stackebrandtia sp.]|uniref:DUF881 domain-containing protein n=1 Tax=Stackebrandtia sp. TaxID=2023065 RepID=UPI002D4784B0|nr:DUF881 domain-containing protein [Stackebrandtia sp.]HZE37184.1 DUF881 domain-containing protein [Stackebrandtia sp.]